MSDYNGLVLSLDEAEYHAHDSLSSTGARELLRSPATFAWGRKHPRADTAAFDVGSAAHSKVLGVGAPIAVIPEGTLASNGAASTAAAKAFIAKARTEGAIPVKQAVADEVDAMAEAVLAHPKARRLMELPGHSEVSAFATDPVTGVRLRARFDRLPDDRSRIIDLKSSEDASPDGFNKSVGSYGYFIQEPHYSEVLALVEGVIAPMEFIVVEKKAPHLVAVHTLSDEYREIGETYAQKARAIYAACTEADIWPGYPEKQNPLMPPFWLTAQYMETRIA
jgi:hypothetical protein